MTHAPIDQVCFCNIRGWLPGVTHAPIKWAMNAANTVTTMQPVVIVDHIMQGYLSTMLEWTVNGASRVIAHFGVARDGRTVQMHPIFSPGIHATNWDPNSPLTALRVKQRAVSPNAYSIGIEHEGASVDPRPAYSIAPEMIYSAANPWPEAMVQASVRVKAWCFAQAPSLGTPSRESIIGHYETGDPNRVNDPAAATDRSVWPVERMIAALAPFQPYADSEYTVIRPGEWMSRVASRVGVPVTTLVALNNIPNANLVRAWQVLRLHSGVPIPEPPPVERPDVSPELNEVLTSLERARTMTAAALAKQGG